MSSAERAQARRSRILVAVDCSDPSNFATDEAVRLAKLWGAEVTGLHAYAAKLHDHRFRQMEGGLPEQYRVEDELERQRDVHDDLITRGLRLITDAYLDQTERSCAEANVGFRRLGREGRNYKVVLDELREGDYDLLVLGAQGLGAVQPGLIGTVCERVVRRTTADTFVLKTPERALGQGPILVALDGSHQSFGGLLTALELGRQLGVAVHAVAVYDPYFHYVAFKRIADVLSEEAGRVFRFEEQEKLHEDIIDSGLAKIYQAHLRIAESVAKERGVALETTLLDGKPYDAILKHLPKLAPSLLVLGKVGIHGDDELDIGGNTQHLLRLADCNLWISVRTYEPDVVTIANETTSWTEEAEARMERVPDFVRRMARMAILRYAQERGHTVITASIVEQATNELMPGHAHRAMQELVAASDEDRIGSDPRAGLAVAWSDAARALLARVEDPALRSNLELRAEKSARRTGATRVEVAHVRPLLPEPDAGAADRLPWTDGALARLERVPEGFMREASRERIEAHARAAGAAEITLEVVEGGLAEARRAMAEAMKSGAGPGGAERTERALPWDPEALALLERVPEGFMRDLTAQRTEARAERLGHARITREVVQDQFDSWQAHSERVTRELEWDGDAWTRVLKAPPVVRGMIVREIEAGARREGLARVTAEYFESARRTWRQSGQFHVAPTEEY
jgi:nucleotide-binding universal stress UspA family protein